MHQIHPKKLQAIKNKSIPNPLRPIFRSKIQTSIYFLSQRKVANEKKVKRMQRIKIGTTIAVLLIGGYFLSN